MKKFARSSLVICWTLYCVIGIITNAHKYNFIDWIVAISVFLFPFIVVYMVKRKKRKALSHSAETISSTDKVDGYIQSSNVTYRTDGKPISDSEVPYLIQTGYENALRKQQESQNPKFHRTEQEEELSLKFFEKYHGIAYEKADKACLLYNEAIKTKDLSKRIELLNEAVVAFEKAKKYCYSKGKGGTIYFQDMWEYMHNSQNPCYSYLDVIQEALNNAISERDMFIPDILNVISENDGILQKYIYDKVPHIPKSDVQRIIRNLETENKLERVKKSGSYELHIVKQ